RDDLRPLYVTGYGLSIGKKDDELQVRDKREVIQAVRINDISHVNVFGTVSVSSAVVQVLSDEEKPIAYFSFGGWFYGLTRGLGPAMSSDSIHSSAFTISRGSAGRRSRSI